LSRHRPCSTSSIGLLHRYCHLLEKTRLGTPSRPAAPGFLFPLLDLVEQLDRRRRRIRRIRAGGILGLEEGRYRGSTVRLRDGTTVRRGDRIGVLHFDNRVIRSLPAKAWLSVGMRMAQDDLRALARSTAASPMGERPVAFRGTTLLGALLRRAGWDVRARRRTAWTRLEDWYLRAMLARWSREGSQRLRHGRGALRSTDGWLSAAALQRRYGPQQDQ
jgi:hypothetical protein